MFRQRSRTGKEQKISSLFERLSKDEIEKMRPKRKRTRRDKKAKEASRSRTTRHARISVRETVEELGDKSAENANVEDAIAAVREDQKNDTDAIKRAYDDLQSKFQESAPSFKTSSAAKVQVHKPVRNLARDAIRPVRNARRRGAT